MGNYLACGAPVRVLCSASSMEKPSSAVTRLVHTDGTIEDITRPVTVAELMLEHPLHFVCHVKSFESDISSSSSSSNKCSLSCDEDRPLPADYELESGEIYYLRSKAGFNCKSPLRQLRRSVSESFDKHRYSIQQQQQQQQKKGSSSSLFQAFRMKQKGPITQVTVSGDFVAQLLSKHFAQEQHVTQNVESHGRVPSGSVESSGNLDDHSNPELQMAYQMRLISRSVSWRPKLATIDESNFS